MEIMNHLSPRRIEEGPRKIKKTECGNWIHKRIKRKSIRDTNTRKRHFYVISDSLINNNQTTYKVQPVKQKGMLYIGSKDMG